MKQYIDKDALVALIKKIYNEDYKFLPSDIVDNIQDFKDDILRNIDTLDVKKVDLEKEIKDYFDSQPIITRSKGVDYRLIPTGVDIARHFFELGNKAQNGEYVWQKN